MQKIDLTGRVFGHLIVDGYAGSSMWSCSCDCGEKTTVDGQNLRRGATKSCGWCGVRDLTGRQFYRWSVLGPGADPQHWRCRCACGTVRDVAAGSLRAHRSKSCGCGPRIRRDEDGWC
jgi:hypothetical protein